MTRPLTAVQEQALEFIRSCDRSPSYREIASGIGSASTGRVFRIVRALERKGFLTRVGGKIGNKSMARSLTVTEGPAPGLSDYTTEQLLAELSRRHGAAREH